MKYYLKYLFIVALISNGVFAKNVSSVKKEFARFESVVLPNTQIRKIHSEFAKQNYRIYVNIPASYYEEPNKKYPALFTLDADYSFAMVKQTSEHLSDRSHVPEMFVFGIAYDGPLNYRVNRTRDYTPTHVADGGYGPEFQKFSGGGVAFADFLEKELLPYLEKHFRISNQRVLVGHSYGGLFASWMLVARPQAFNGYISISPSLWYDNHLMFNLEKTRASLMKGVQARAFFGVGSRETKKFGTTYAMVEDTERFAGALKSRKHKGLEVRSVVFQDENHDTVFPAALTRGIMFIFGAK